MVQLGMLLSDVPRSVPPEQQFRDVLRIVGQAKQDSFTHIAPTMSADETVEAIRRTVRDVLPSILPLPARTEIPSVEHS